MKEILRAFPRVMGIVNINDDSFSGDGTLDLDKALRQAMQMARDGADIIDVGAESARTNRGAISVEEETARLLPFIDSFHTLCAEISPRDDIQIWPPLLSVNDIGGMVEDINARLCLEFGAALLLMHTVGEPKVPHTSQQYSDLWSSLETFFEDRIARARAIGLSDDQLIIDPGIDFAKQCADNLLIFRELERLTQYDLPILLPISRKTVIGDVLGLPNPQDRDAGTIACLVRGLVAQANIFRVHHVRAVVDSVRVIAAIRHLHPERPCAPSGSRRR